MTMTLGYRAALAVTMTAAVIACSGITGLTSRAEPGLVIINSDTAVIAAPDTVDDGTAFGVRIQTFGGGCTRSTARVEVVVTGLLAEIRPYNLTRMRSNGVCTSDLLYLFHELEVRFATAGVATIRVIGEQQGGSTGGASGPAVLERHLVVR